jgi:hypothetical protein
VVRIKYRQMPQLKGLFRMRLFFVSAIFACTLLVMSLTQAQAEPLVVEPITQDKLEKMIFTDTPEGCIRKLNFFAVGLHGYKKATPVEEMGEMKIIQPFIKKIYDNIQKDGPTNAMVGAMNEFQSCAEKFQSPVIPESTQKTEGTEAGAQETNVKPYQERQQAFFNSCGAMNAIALTALDGVANNSEQAAIEGKVGAVEMDAVGTIFERAEAPQKIVVSSIYDASKNGGYEKAVETGFGLIIQCFATK